MNEYVEITLVGLVALVAIPAYFFAVGEAADAFWDGRQDKRDAQKALANAMKKVRLVAEPEPALQAYTRTPDIWEQLSERVFAKAELEGTPLNSWEDCLAAVKRYEPNLDEAIATSLAATMACLLDRQRQAA